MAEGSRSGGIWGGLSVTCDKETGGDCHGEAGGEGALCLGNVMGLQRPRDEGGDSHALNITESMLIIRNQPRIWQTTS